MKTYFNFNPVLAPLFFMLCLLAFASLPGQAEIPEPSPMEIMDTCPTASFSIVNNGVDAGTPVQFANFSTGGSTYLWDFGDGNSSTAVSPSHVYGSAGTYTVKLTVTGGGCTVEFVGTEDVLIF